MKRAQAILVICLLVVSLIAAWRPTLTAKACSGGQAVTIEDMIYGAEYIVHGTVRTSDIGKQNGIVEVDAYLKGGTGPKYLMLVQTEPSQMLLFAGLTDSGTCAAMGPRLFPGESLYWFVKRNPLDGSYRLAYRSSWGISAYKYTRGGTREFYSDDSNAILELTEPEFINYILNRTRQRLEKPIQSNMLPRTAPLILTTMRGSSYVLPVDQVVARKVDANLVRYASSCWQLNCVAASKDGTWMVTLDNDGDLKIQAPVMMSSRYLKGQAFAVAPKQFRIAVWNNDALQIYLRISYEIKVGASTTVAKDSKSRLQAVWSDDGIKLAYTDDKGLWLWTLPEFNSDWEEREIDSPRLIVPRIGNITAVPRYFSPLGHYLAITEGQKNSTLDLNTGERLLDGWVSPNDQTLLTAMLDENVSIGTASNGPRGEMLTAPLPYFCDLSSEERQYCQAPQPYKPRYTIGQVAWIGERKFAYVACPFGKERETSVCSVYDSTTTAFGNSYEGVGFDVEPQSGKMVILKDDFTITLDGIDYDLRQFVDSEITSIQWLPSLMSSIKITWWM